MMTHQQFENELRMLQGNINRMCLTDNEKELATMRDWAKYRIDQIYDYRQDQIRKNALKDGES